MQISEARAFNDLDRSYCAVCDHDIRVSLATYGVVVGQTNCETNNVRPCLSIDHGWADIQGDLSRRRCVGEMGVHRRSDISTWYCWLTQSNGVRAAGRVLVVGPNIGGLRGGNQHGSVYICERVDSDGGSWAGIYVLVSCGGACEP